MKLTITLLLTLFTFCCFSTPSYAADMDKEWKLTGDFGITYASDENKNTNKDFWQLFTDSDLKLAKIKGLDSYTHHLNVDIGKNVDNGVTTQTPDLFEYDFDWRREKGKDRYAFLNLSVDTNSKFKNNLLTSITGGYGYRLNQYWTIEPGFGVAKNFKPKTDAEALVSLKALFHRDFGNDISLNGHTEATKNLGNIKDVVGKTEWKLKKKLVGNMSVVWNYRLDYQKNAPVSKTWSKNKLYLSWALR